MHPNLVENNLDKKVKYRGLDWGCEKSKSAEFTTKNWVNWS